MPCCARGAFTIDLFVSPSYIRRYYSSPVLLSTLTRRINFCRCVSPQKISLYPTFSTAIHSRNTISSHYKFYSVIQLRDISPIKSTRSFASRFSEFYFTTGRVSSLPFGSRSRVPDVDRVEISKYLNIFRVAQKKRRNE